MNTTGITMNELCFERPFARAASYLVGPMCCTPERAGLDVAFAEFKLGEAKPEG